MSDERTESLIIAGIMTGNSLDAVDVAVFRARLEGDRVTGFEQISFYSEPCSGELRALILELKDGLRKSNGLVTSELQGLLQRTHDLYHAEVNHAVSQARVALRAALNLDVDLIGFHGQTLAHIPPSVAKGEQVPYTIQLVNGALLADTQGITTVADFRSDDLLNGGEGAPFAPGFNALLTPALGVGTAAFINAGNTSNICVFNLKSQDLRGWDCGPCNQFPDQLMREERQSAIDRDGLVARTGVVDSSLIEILWKQAVTRQDGTNALDIVGPRSFDPQWYRLPKELKDANCRFEDRLRTVVAFSAYCVAHSIGLAVAEGFSPEAILLFGGGWRNPVLRGELEDLILGRANYILEPHRALFSGLSAAVKAVDAQIKLADEAGLPNNGMEAGIFAFAALQRLLGQPFTRPSFTGCRSPTVCGVVFIPSNNLGADALSRFKLTDQRGVARDPRLGRAAPGNC